MKLRKILVPEVVQTSSMDCGPAALKCLLEGFGVRASYGRLREACQTDVDGTSIDTMEDVARQLGLDAEQIMLPLDHLLRAEARALPALVVVRLPNGVTHFVVAWRRLGPLVQLMDPATGRRWTSRQRFLQEVYVHTMPVPAAAWREWAGSEAFLSVLCRRLRNLGVRPRKLVETALADVGWRALGVLDAATRMTDSLVRSGGVRKGRQAARVLEALCAREEMIPEGYWTVRPRDDETISLRGAVLVHVRGRLAQAETPASPELAAALREPPSRPVLHLLRLLRADGVLAPAALVAALALAAAGVTTEAVLLRGWFDLGRELGLSGQRLAAVGALVVFLLAMLLLEFPLASSLLRMGRHLEARLRMAFLEKLPKLGDRYLQSRLKSDMADRSHRVHKIRRLPDLGGQLTRSVFELILTAAGIAWIDPASAPLAVLTAAAGVALPLAMQPVIMERDLRLQSHTGALSRYYLDALLGLVPIRTHGAERSVRREHSNLLAEWARAALRLQRSVVSVEAVQFTAGFGLAAWLLIDHLARTGEAGGVLLLVYWALNLPVLGQEIARVAWQYPSYRNTTLRLLEPLGALEDTVSGPAAAVGMTPRAASGARGMAVALENVSVRAAGHTILEGINLRIQPGSHVAIVGPSGAGKSSLVGILLGWHRPARGRVAVDGEPLDARVETVRREIAWVDPVVQLWNRSFYENLRYGSADGTARPVAEVIDAADLRRVLERLPDGFETALGEGGALVSGGEGQRVRLGRAMLRPGVRLVILDEPFRGLDREQRRALLARARGLWRHATLLCITHDVAETRGFDRVLVIERGRIVENDTPERLAARSDSRYRALLEAEDAVRTGLWSAGDWRALRLEDGRLDAVVEGR